MLSAAQMNECTDNADARGDAGDERFAVRRDDVGPRALQPRGQRRGGHAWTSGTLSDGTNYWFTVSVLIGTTWTGAQSVASGESASNNESPFCVQL